MNMSLKSERYVLKQAAEDKKNELNNKGVAAWIYKGHRDYVLQYEEQSSNMIVDNLN